MNTTTKQGAKWVHTQDFKLNAEQGGCIRVSEKAAISVSLYNQSGEREDLFFVTGPVAQRMIDNAVINIPGLEELLASDTFQAILENKERAKEQNKIEAQKLKVASRLLLQQQAIQEQLATLGFVKK